MHDVPLLDQSVIRSFKSIEQVFLRRQIDIESWFREQCKNALLPITCSVDIRNSGYKLTPVDTNVFPAGYNNLSEQELPLCVQAFEVTISQIYPGCQRILIIPESHTRNVHYYHSLFRLQQIVQQAGYDVKVGTIADDIKQPQTIQTTLGELEIIPVTRIDNILMAGSFKPCMILLNNDLSSGIPAILQNLKQPIHPSLLLGWPLRRKSNHFEHYRLIAKQFANLIEIDPWIITPTFLNCGNIDFNEKESLECLMGKAETVLADIRNQYKERQIKEEPFVAIKSDYGTYGLGIMMVNDITQISTMNRKQRNRMSMAKGGKTVDAVIIQEGVYSFETWQEAVAEPVVYLVGRDVVGGFYRVHQTKGISDNLNTAGMEFKALPFVESCNRPDKYLERDIANRFYIYGVIARLALLAAAAELKEANNDR